MTQSLKIGKLPDTTPVKHTISVEPDLDDILKSYAEIYEQTYGEKASVPALIPSMLRAFIASDSGFKKTLRDAQSS